MSTASAVDTIELSLLQACHTVITERSVSRAALKLRATQPALSGQLKRLRGLIGGPLRQGAQGLQRRSVVRSPHFGLAPAMLARAWVEGRS